MNPFQFLFALFLGMVLYFTYNYRHQTENNLPFKNIKTDRKTFIIEPLLLPAFLVVAILIHLYFWNETNNLSFLAQSIFLLSLMSIYYLALLFLLPIFRKIFSARICASLWSLPIILHVILYKPTFSASEPFMTLTFPKRYLLGFTLIWSIGFVLLLSYLVLSHLFYRRHLLNSARELKDEEILSMWKNGLLRHGVKHQIPIYTTEQVHTPLTIGVFDRTMVCILPNKKYTEEELDLIFRHELLHILRADSRMKFFIDFCTALCWFNPLFWIARKKISDDLELSVDEQVLKDAGEKEKNLYVNLLLKSAANGKAYSTQLSAAASSLRYRLKNVLQPKKRISNGLILSIVLFLLAMSLGTISLADGSTPLGESIFNESRPVKLVEVTSNHLNDDSSEKYIHGFKEKELVDYLSSLKGRQLYYGEKEEKERTLMLSFRALSFENEKRMIFCINDKFVTLYDPFDQFRKKTFLLDAPVDWEYLKSLLDLRTEDPNPLLHPPELKLYFGKGEQFEEEAMHAAMKVLFSMIDGQEKDLSTMRYEESIGGISGSPVERVRLEFSYPPEEEYTITVKELSGSKVYSLSSQELKDHLLPLAPYSAIYKIQARFRDGSTNHLVEYSFKVELPE